MEGTGVSDKSGGGQGIGAGQEGAASPWPGPATFARVSWQDVGTDGMELVWRRRPAVDAAQQGGKAEPTGDAGAQSTVQFTGNDDVPGLPVLSEAERDGLSALVEDKFDSLQLSNIQGKETRNDESALPTSAELDARVSGNAVDGGVDTTEIPVQMRRESGQGTLLGAALPLTKAVSFGITLSAEDTGAAAEEGTGVEWQVDGQNGAGAHIPGAAMPGAVEGRDVAGGATDRRDALGESIDDRAQDGRGEQGSFEGAREELSVNGIAISTTEVAPRWLLPRPSGRAQLWELTDKGWVRKEAAVGLSIPEGAAVTAVREPSGSRAKSEDAAAASLAFDGPVGESLIRAHSMSKAVVTDLPNLVASGALQAAATKDGERQLNRLRINLDLELYRARRWAQRGRAEKAEQALKMCIRDWPEDGRAYVSLGKLLQKGQRWKEARQVYEEGCQATGGDSAYLWQAWAVLEQRLGNVGRARRLFDAATVADKRHSASWHGLALLELKEGNKRKARDLLEKGLRFCGADAYLYQSLGLMEVKEGNVEEARSLFRKATVASNASAASWLAWAQLEAEQGQVTEARRLFQRTLEASPRNRYAYLAWARLEATCGQRERARRLFQTGVALNPKDACLRQAFALFEFECGFPGTARSIFREAVDAVPPTGSLWRGWAWLEWKEGRLDTARQLYETAARVDPKSPRVYHAWAVLEERAGNPALAREMFRRALRADASCTAAWISWAAMEERLGNSVRADELRSLCMQQRTEVVEPSWEFSDMIAPALDRVKAFFSASSPSLDQQRAEKLGGGEWGGEGGEGEGDEESAEAFNLEAFLESRLRLQHGALATDARWGQTKRWRRPIGAEEAEKARVKAQRFNQRSLVLANQGR
eukprot:TRINITY_DN3930_c0_g1_i1.p1 TRINITY_DN3930_c0_g1~~TRINITY_DN3930_c0_g1_i1.p1  ORF type:complete len:911 (-),score=220.49 TRINITY_DN3930_c0_g1_i1:60-2696(-)